jgi:hypothetical protein
MTMMVREMQWAGRRLALCLVYSFALPTLQLLAQEAPNEAPKTLPGALHEVVVSPAPRRISRGAFEDNPGCINAKLDLWTGRGRYSYQLFTGGKTWDDERVNPPTQVTVADDTTTIFIGRDGCRLRIRIDRAE